MFFKKSFKEKRAMVLWRRAYKERLLNRARTIKHKYGIDASKVLLPTINNS